MRATLNRLRRRRPSATTAKREEQTRSVQNDNQPQTNLPLFTYDPLPEPQNNIRLIEIHPGADDEVVSCTLTSWSIPEAGSSEDSPSDSETDSTSPTPIQATDQPPNEENRSGNSSAPTSSGSAAQTRRRSPGASRKESSLPAAPRYYAISYTWGSPEDTTLIHINGREMRVRINCDYVLRQGRRCGESRFFWVDALCINQADMDEKSHQVAMMGNIFTKAQSVMACVGPHHDDSEMLFQTLAKHQPLFYMAGLASSYIFPPEFFSMLRKWRLTTRGTTIVRLFRAVLCLFRRQYFTRLWIFQELSLARSGLILCCGEAHQPFSLAFGLRRILHQDLVVRFHEFDFNWESLADNSYLISGLTFQHWAMCLYRQIRKKDTSNMYESSRKRDVPRLLFSYRYVLEIGTHRDWYACLHAYLTDPVFKMLQGAVLWLRGKMGRPDEFGDLLRLTSHLNCEDRRDKVYGILSVVDWQGACSISPDYTITPFQLALRILTSGILYNHVSNSQSALLGDNSQLNLSRTATLVGSLGLDLEDCQEMKDALNRRRYDIKQLPDQGEQGDSHEPPNLLEDAMGLQIPPALPIDPSSSTTEWEFADEAGSMILVKYLPEKRESAYRIHHEIRIGLPIRAQAGDWILAWSGSDMWSTLGLLPALLVRKQQDSDSYSIIGHALLGSRAAEPRFTASFHLELSPEDYLVYGTQAHLIRSNMLGLWIDWNRGSNFLNSCFCRAAQSSIARLHTMLDTT